MKSVIFLSAIIIASAINIEYVSKYNGTFSTITISLLIFDLMGFINKNK